MVYENTDPDPEQEVEPSGSASVANDQDSDPDHLQLQNKQELIDTVIHLQKHVANSNNTIRNYKGQINLLMRKRKVFEEALELTDHLVSTESYISESSTRTTATSALPKKIDSNWEDTCDKSEHWNTWWKSDKPKRLRYSCHTSQADHPTAISVRQRQNKTSRQIKKADTVVFNKKINNSRNDAVGINNSGKVQDVNIKTVHSRINSPRYSNHCEHHGHTEETCRYRTC